MSVAVTFGPSRLCLWVSRNLKFSFSNLLAYKYHPKHRKLFAKSKKSWCAWSFLAVAFWGALLVISYLPIEPSCVTLQSLPSQVVFTLVWGVHHALTNGLSCYPATGFLSLQSSCRSYYRALRRVQCSHYIPTLSILPLSPWWQVK